MRRVVGCLRAASSSTLRAVSLAECAVAVSEEFEGESDALRRTWVVRSNVGLGEVRAR